MPVLHNRISNDALKAKMLAESEPRTTISFYKYFHIADPLRWTPCILISNWKCSGA